jgi:uncharacterized protein (UPF0332 family)
MTPFDWEEFLEFAEEQVKRRGNPAAERSAISRAYYAVFHRAKSYYLAKGETLTYNAADHASVKDWFEHSGNRDVSKIGLWIGRLRQSRRDADYEDRFPNLSSEAESAIIAARRAIDAISRLV